MILERGGHVLLVSVTCSLIACCAILSDTESLEASRRGTVRASLAVAAFAAWGSLVTEMYRPFKLPATFVNTIFSMLTEDVTAFLMIFLPLVGGFATAINALLHDHPGWMTRWSSWWLTVENLLLLSFIGEPPTVFAGGSAPYDHDSLSTVYPSSVTLLFGEMDIEGPDAILPVVLFFAFFFLFALISVILLVNLVCTKGPEP